MSADGIGAALILAFFIALFFAVQKPAPSIDGFTPVKQTSPQYVAWSPRDGAISTVQAVDKSSGAVLADLRRDADGVLREEPAAASRASVEIRETPIIAFGRRADQLGTFAGYFAKRDGVDRFQVGLHYEPCAVFFDTISGPSLAVTRDLAGIGAIVHLPPRAFPRLAAIGLGAWGAAPFDGSAPGLLVGATFQITIP